jgi:hypothetical protein
MAAVSSHAEQLALSNVVKETLPFQVMKRKQQTV